MTDETSIQTSTNQQLTEFGKQDPVIAQAHKEKQKNSLAQTMWRSLRVKWKEVGNLVSGWSKKHKNKRTQKKEDPYLITVPLDKFETKLAKKRWHIS